jgi:cytochrome c oxidase subunit 2
LPTAEKLLPRRTALLVLLAAALLALLVAPGAALADVFTPESGGSPNADDIDSLYKIVLYIAIVIFVGVEGTLVYSLVKYRARRRGPEPELIRGNTPLEIGWTVGAALILVVLTTFTFIYLGDIKNPQRSGPDGFQSAGSTQFASVDQPNPPGGKALQIGVVGRQYLWRYDYPGKPGELFSYYDMVVPVDTTVTLKIRSSDVAHSWWVPKLGGKADAVPGHTNETWFKVRKPGTYRGACAELCGENHADMRARVIALEVADFEAWADRQKNDIKAAQTELADTRKQREAAEKASRQQ